MGGGSSRHPFVLTMFALADCNNFYPSCIRVFQPSLNGKPVVVLSNNDGCVIARSNEAKLLQVAMGAPYFKIERYVKQEGIAVFSSNYALFGDLSNRVMQVLSGFAPQIEEYSIDECFLDFTGFRQDLTDYSLLICKTVQQWTGIPISIGIAPTKTLAKLANRLAKKGYAANGQVLDWRTVTETESVLKTIALDELWGISGRTAAKLKALEIHNALDLSQADPKRLRLHLGVVMERIVCELQGISCIPLEAMPTPRKQILTSRSFGEKLTLFDDLRAAVSYFATRSAHKLRQQHLTTSALNVFVATSPFDTKNPYYSNSATMLFNKPTHHTADLVQAAHLGLKKIYKPGLYYQRAGVLLPELQPVGVVQKTLFDGEENTGQPGQLMDTLDTINRRYGNNSICYASELLSTRWCMRQQFKSPSYTTQWTDLLTINL